MKESIEAMLWDFIADNNIATEDEVRLVTNINGWKDGLQKDGVISDKLCFRACLY